MSIAYECTLVPSFSFVGIPSFGNKPFTLTHCWTIICDCEKFKEHYAALKKNGGPEAVVEYHKGEKRPRGKTNSKLNEKRDAGTFALQETLQGMMTQKKVREERKRQKKEEQMKAYIEIQKKKLKLEENVKTKKLEIEATNAKTKAKELALTFMAKEVKS
jgi:hypothetical protein